MPIENERKIVLKPGDYKAIITYLKKIPGAEAQELTQGYLDGDGRIRNVVFHDEPNKDPRYIFTYKTKVAGKTVEIETDISKHDYDKLWSIAKNKLVKTRITIPVEAPRHEEHWDIDFFSDPITGEFYLGMAEVELPEFIDNYWNMPLWLSDHVLYHVDHGDKRFNSKNLNNVKKVEKLLKEIQKKVT